MTAKTHKRGMLFVTEHFFYFIEDPHNFFVTEAQKKTDMSIYNCNIIILKENYWYCFTVHCSRFCYWRSNSSDKQACLMSGDFYYFC